MNDKKRIPTQPAVLEVLQNATEPMTREDIAKITGFSPVQVGNALSHLANKGIAKEVGTRDKMKLWKKGKTIKVKRKTRGRAMTVIPGGKPQAQIEFERALEDLITAYQNLAGHIINDTDKYNLDKLKAFGEMFGADLKS